MLIGRGLDSGAIIELMSNLLLTALVLVSVANLTLFIIFLVSLRRISRVVSDFVSSPDGKSPSPASLVVDALVNRAADSIMIHFKTTFMGILSGESRAARKLEGEAAEAAISEKSPLASIALAAFPSLKKSLGRNPALVQAILSRLVGSVAHGQLPLEPGNHTGNDYGARLARFGG